MNVMQKPNPVRRLTEAGQSVWLDFIRRRFIGDGSLQRLIEEDGIGGVTSNPAIFQKAMGEGADYDFRLQAARAEGGDGRAHDLREPRHRRHPARRRLAAPRV